MIFDSLFASTVCVNMTGVFDVLLQKTRGLDERTLGLVRRNLVKAERIQYACLVLVVCPLWAFRTTVDLATILRVVCISSGVDFSHFQYKAIQITDVVGIAVCVNVQLV